MLIVGVLNLYYEKTYFNATLELIKGIFFIYGLIITKEEKGGIYV